MKQQFDIPVNVAVLAENEQEAEELVKNYMRTSRVCIDEPAFIDWDLVQFVPSDLAQSCCC